MLWRIMKNLTWYYPTTLKEATALLAEPGIVPHGGGTGILRTGTDHLSGLIDLRYLPLFAFKQEDDTVEIGAGLTFSDVLRHEKMTDPDSILVQSLSRAAATPLRNRITVGGSIAMAPVWSDLLGPLIALEAKLVLAGAHEGVIPVESYLQDRALQTGTLITGVRHKAGNWRAQYFRASATRFDYASFTITALAQVDERQIIEALRLVVVGNTQKYVRLAELEAHLTGHKVSDIDFARLGTGSDVAFSAKTIGSADYVRHCFQVELERTLEAVLAP